MNLLLTHLEQRIRPWVESGEFRLHTFNSLKKLSPTQEPSVFRNGASDGRIPAEYTTNRICPRMVCVLDGRAELMVKDLEVHAGPGTFIVLPPGTPQTCECGLPPHSEQGRRFSSDGCSLLWFVRLRERLLCWICHSHGDRHHRRQVEHWLLSRQLPAQLFTLLTGEAEDDDELAVEISQYEMRAFIVAIQRDVEAGRYSQPLQILPEYSELDALEK